MLPILRHAWARSSLSLSLAPATARRAASVSSRSRLSRSNIVRTTPLSKQLARTDVWTVTLRKNEKEREEEAEWEAEKAAEEAAEQAAQEAEEAAEEASDGGAKAKRGRGRPKKLKQPKPKGEKLRVNIVSEGLCDDIIKYIGPTLKRHVGCDLVDINPGAGLWSRKLHEALKPRSHLLMEPDEDLYRPFLKDLLAKPNTRLIRKSGIVWKELTELLSHIENQQPQPRGPDVVPQRNDTLLVTANLCYFPKKKFRSFDSVAVLVLYQLLTSISSGALFQKYGLVRMLVWMGPGDHKSFMAKNVQGRRKSALEAEFSCEWMAEVACKDEMAEPGFKGQRYVRDKWIDVDSTLRTLARMKEAGMKIPKRRKMEMTKQVEGYTLDNGPYAGVRPPQLSRPYIGELEELQKRVDEGTIKKTYLSKDWKRFSFLRHQLEKNDEETEEHGALVAEMYRLARLRHEGSASEEEMAVQEKAWNDKVLAMGKNLLSNFRLIQDNAHVFRQDPPSLLWDRRPYEPIALDAGDFFPNVECALVDIQPKATHPLLREMGPGTTRAGDMFELIRGSMMAASTDPVSKSLDRVWPGAAEGILPHCPSLRDPDRGGMAASGPGEICARALNEGQWMELLEGFMAWPFRPTYEELIGRLADHESGEDDDLGGGPTMSTESAVMI